MAIYQMAWNHDLIRLREFQVVCESNIILLMNLNAGSITSRSLATQPFHINKAF